MISDLKFDTFSKTQQMLWPITLSETKKFLVFSCVNMLLLFNYTILRNLKDSLIFMAPGSGPEVVSFIKGWLVMPTSFLFVILYVKLSQKISQAALFYGVTCIFLSFFTFFCLIGYPLADRIHLSYESIKTLQESYPHFQWVFPVYGAWMYSLFYVFSELWGSVMIAFFFWKFANAVIETDQAKRFYPMFNLFSSIGVIGSSIAVHLVTNQTLKNESFKDIMPLFGLILLLSGILCLSVYYYINHAIFPDEKISFTQENKDKLKLSIKESFQRIFHSAYLRYIAIIVLCYNTTLNLVEVLWKKQITLQFPNAVEYTAFMGNFYGILGVSSILFVFLTKNVIYRYGWFVGAILTPISLFISTTVFFLFFFDTSFLTLCAAYFGIVPSLLIVGSGAFQNIVTKGTKYALYDPTKELAFIPLDPELKAKGKAAIDIFGGRIGKASGGYIQQVLFVLTAGNLLTLSGYFAFCVFALLLLWVIAVIKLNKLYQILLGFAQKKPEENTERSRTLAKFQGKLGI